MTRVLVTGASGFIGRQCLPPLRARGLEVHALYLREPLAAAEGLYWHRGDLLDPAQASHLMETVRPQFLLHLAWYAVPGKYVTARENLNWLEASLRLLHLFSGTGGERVVMAGTCLEYGSQPGLIFGEAEPLRPNTLYGACKLALSRVLDAYSAQTALSSAWGRVFYLYGPHESPSRLIPSVIRNLLDEHEATCLHSALVRDFLYVKDVGSALVALLLSRVQGPVDIASGVGVPLKTVVQTIASRMGRSHRVRLADQPTSEPALVIGNTGRLQDEVGWRPQHTLDSGLDETIDWWKAKIARSR